MTVQQSPHNLDIEAATSTETVTSTDFRNAMSCMAASVQIVTTDGAAGRAGFTATAFSAVSDEPPIVLVCVNRSSHSNGIIKQNGVFCVNTLGGDAEKFAQIFSGQIDLPDGKDKFDGIELKTGVSGSPILPNVLASMDCKLQKTLEMGTHTVFFGAVENVLIGHEQDALIYRNRGYHQL